MKKIRLCIVFCAFIFIAGIVGSLLMLRPVKSSIVEIIQDGKVLHTLDLSKADDQTINIVYQGRINTVSIKKGSICIISADCPDQTCVKMGFLNENALPVVCLPNRLVIQFVQPNGDADAITQ